MASLRGVVPVLSRSICRQCRTSLAQPQIAPPYSRVHAARPHIARPSITVVRWHSAPASNSKVYGFEQIRQISESPSEDQILIDVREPSEFSEGYIPGAINIPIKSQPDAIMLPEEEFEDRFGFSKPETDKEVVFYCRSGVRSSAAAQLAQQHGYKNIAEYRGSWIDWQDKGGAAEKP